MHGQGLHPTGPPRAKRPRGRGQRGAAAHDVVDQDRSRGGRQLREADADPAVYEFSGDELYVRATVVSDRDHPNPYAEGDKEMAWVQPVQPGE